MSKVVLAYAGKYWKPGMTPFDGIGLVAQSCFEGIKLAYPHDEPIYLDATEHHKMRGIKDVSALFSISSNIHKFVKTCKPVTSTLISVNESSLMRRTIKDRANQSGLSSKYLTAQDGIYSNLKETKNIDFVLGFGSWSLFQSYKKVGYDPMKVFPIGWHYWRDFEKNPPQKFGNKIVAYMGAISYRKGIDKIIEIAKYLSHAHPTYRLELIGFVWNEKWRQELLDLSIKYQNNFNWVDERIDYGRDNWKRIKADSCFAVFPSYEEGLSGCAMDIVNLGIPLFHSPKTGLEASHESVFQMDFDAEDWLARLSEIIDAGAELWRDVYNKQKWAAFHQNENNYSISRAMGRISRGYIWPKVEVSNDLLMSLETDGSDFLRNMMNSQDPEYKISNVASKKHTSLNVHYPTSVPISSLESIQLALFLADKYNNFKVLNFENVSGASTDISIINLNPSGNLEHLSDTNLWMSPYTNSFLENGGKITALKFRENLYTLNEMLKYRFGRYFNILLIKLRLIIRDNLKNDL